MPSYTTKRCTNRDHRLCDVISLYVYFNGSHFSQSRSTIWTEMNWSSRIALPCQQSRGNVHVQNYTTLFVAVSVANQYEVGRDADAGLCA